MQGISSFCQECGACEAGSGASNYSVGITNSGAVTYCGQTGSSLADIIAAEVTKTILSEARSKNQTPSGGLQTIPLGVSNRHMHITKELFAQLFGADQQFEVYRDLYEPGEFASKQCVTVIGPKQRAIQNLRILGPFRKYNQVEVALTDAVALGIRPPIGDLSKGAPLTIVGPKGSVYLEHVAVIANRHVHMSDEDAKGFGLKNGDYIKVRIPGEKGLILENVLVRTDPTWKLMMHLDTDDANAAHVTCNTAVEVVGKM